MIDRLLACLRSVDLRPTPEELAEALWLAQYLPAAARPEEPAGPLPRQTEPEPTPGREPPPSSEQKPEETRPTPPPGASQPLEGAKLVPPALPGESGEAVVQRSLVRVPAAAALPHALKLGHAFRPLRRRVASRTRVVLDESATVYQIAETWGRLWSPVFAPASTRWMELALVVDGSPSMAIWAQTISELERLLERLGAFRDIRRWTLDTVDPREVRLHAGHAAPVTRTARPLRELMDPTGRRLVLVVSDCIAPAWNTGAVMRALSVWGRAGPVALVQVLPQRLWVRTGLGLAVRAPLRARSRGSANVHLEPELQGRSRYGLPRQGLPMPVFPLDPPSIAEWARMLAGGGMTSAGLVLPPSPWIPLEDTEGEAAPVDPVRLIQDFQGTASPLAQELASILSAAPLYLPAMRVVQRAMLPEARQVHLAEVLLGGLLKEVKRDARPSWANEALYEFLPGVRPRLLDSLKRGSALDVLRQVSDFLGVRFGKGRDFAAALVAPDGDIQLEASEADDAFAMVATTVLRRLGGRYARIAEQLQSRAPGFVPGPREEVRQESTPAASEVPAPLREEERIRQACALVNAGAVVGNAYLVEPRRFISSAAVFREVGTGGRAQVRSIRGLHEATVLGMDLRSECAVVELDEALEGITPLELAEETTVGETVHVYGFSLTGWDELHPWQGAGALMHVQPGNALGGDSLVLTLADRSSAREVVAGMPVLAGGTVVGHVSPLAWEGATGSMRGMCSARQVRRLLSPGEWTPRGQRVLVVGTGDADLLTPEIVWVSQALGQKLAREGYGLIGGGWPGVDEQVGRAYLAALRLIGTKPEELFLQVVAPGVLPTLREGVFQRTTSPENVEAAILEADAVVLIGGAEFTRQVYERARAERKPVFPIPGLGGTSDNVYKLLLRRWDKSSFGGLSLREMEALNLRCGSREDASELMDRLTTLMVRSLAAPLDRPSGFARDMLDLLLSTEPLFLELRASKRPGPAWMTYVRDLVRSIGGAESDVMGTLLERLGYLVTSSGTDPTAQRNDAIARLRRGLPDSGSWLLKEFLTLARIGERGELKWRLMAQLAPLVLERREEGLVTIASALKETKASGPDVYVEAILHAVENQFKTSSEFRDWLFDVLGKDAWLRYPVPSTASLIRLSKDYLLSQEDDAAERALAELREEIRQISPPSRSSRLPEWLDGSDASNHLLAYLLMQIQPDDAIFDLLARHLTAALSTRGPAVNPRLLGVLITTLMVVVEATFISERERRELGESVRRSLDEDPERWPRSRDESPMGQLHMLQVLCGGGSRPMTGLMAVGPRIVVMGKVTKRSPRRLTLTPGKVQSGHVRSWKSFVEEFKALESHERFVAFGQEAHLVKRGMTAKRVGAWQLSFEIAEAIPRTTYMSGGERIADFVAGTFSRAFEAARLWERLGSVASQLPDSQSWALMLNNLLRLEAIRLAALPAHALDLQSRKTALRCIERVWNVVALRNVSDHIFEAGMVLDIRGYGPWAGIVQLTREQPLPPMKLS
ncbi:SAV_2336 N-terminal domain-related protein [Myxococcus sp. Y35]|uniref:SAV_2336 N-terminal domain-related protein n=1 Tax=Pseudomyxococcus flavus TaxID=3115648 RepID=UPI003CF44D7B